jgi:hypothetical protein
MGVCDRVHNEGDDLIYEQHRDRTQFHKDVPPWFNLQEKHWNEGWGWGEDDPKYAFPKMLNAVWMLYLGFESPKWLNWGSDNLSASRDPSTPVAYDISALYNAPTDQILVFGLRHSESVGSGSDKIPLMFALNPDGASERQFPIAMDAGMQLRLMSGNLLSCQDDDFQYLLGTNSQGEIIHYWRPQGVSTWRASNVSLALPSEVRPYITPAIQAFSTMGQSGQRILHLFYLRDFALEPCPGIVHAQWPSNGAWTAEWIPYTAGPFAHALATADGALHALVLRDTGIDHLLLPPSGTWLTTHVETGCDFVSTGWDGSSVLATDQSAIYLYRRSASGDLVEFSRDSQGGWAIENLTQLPGIGEQYRLRYRPSAARGCDGTNYVVGVNQSRHLIYYSRSPLAAWTASDLTAAYRSDDLQPFPTILIGPDAQPHVFVKATVSEDVIHYYRRPIPDTSANYAATQVLSLPLSPYAPPNPPNWVVEDLTAGRPAKTLAHGPVALAGPAANMTALGVTYDNDLICYCNSGRGLPWHRPGQYAEWAAGKSGCTESDWRYEPEYGDDFNAYAEMGLAATDRVEMACPTFAEDYGPGLRAGTMVHEATHIRLGSWKGVFRHDHHKDPWYHHLLGEASNFSRSKKKMHTPYQLQAEFLADLALFPQPWIPVGVVEEARDRFKYLIENKFTNDVPWTLDEPKPL